MTESPNRRIRTARDMRKVAFVALPVRSASRSSRSRMNVSLASTASLRGSERIRRKDRKRASPIQRARMMPKPLLNRCRHPAGSALFQSPKPVKKARMAMAGIPHRKTLSKTES
jgi:hypothetical protein